MAQLAIWLIVSIAVLLVLVMRYKVNASIALIIASLIMGIGSGIPINQVASDIADGFGGFMRGSGLPIGFGIILGQLLYDYGGATSIARSIVRVFPQTKALYAIALAALIISIPVFFDITFVLLIPLGIAIAQENNIKLPYVVIAIVCGAMISHTLIPPTPAPLAAAQILGFDLGIMIIGGIIIGGIACFICLPLMFRIMGSKWFWNESKDESSEMQTVAFVPPIADGRSAPNFIISLFPILVPVILILLNTVTGAVVDTNSIPPMIVFLGDKTVAMLLGALTAMIIASRNLSLAEMEKSCNESLKSAGLVLLITGAGGAFGKILTNSGLPKVIVEQIGNASNAPLLILVISYLIAMVLRIAQGSSTVAGITTLNIMAAAIVGVNIHPMWVAIATMAGAFSIGHVNDSGFWIISNRTGLTVSGGLKAITFSGFVLSLLVFALAFIAAVIMPTF